MQPETTAKRHFRLIDLKRVLKVIALASISAALFLGSVFLVLSFGNEKSTLQGITTGYHRPINLVFGFAMGLASVAHLYAIVYFLPAKWEKMPAKKETVEDITPILILTSLTISIVFSSYGWIMFSHGYCNWIRLDSDQVTSGLFITTRSMRFDQMKEVNFTDLESSGTTKDGHTYTKRWPIVEFELKSSEKVTWFGYPLIYVEQEFQQMLELKEIPFSNRRSQSYLSEKNESSNANRQSTEDYVAKIRAERQLEEILGSRWRHFSEFGFGDGKHRGEEVIIEFRSDKTGTIQIKFGPQTVVDTDMTFEVVPERDKWWPTLHITLSDESTVIVGIIASEEHAHFHSPSANGQLAEKIARFFKHGFERQPLDPANAK